VFFNTIGIITSALLCIFTFNLQSTELARSSKKKKKPHTSHIAPAAPALDHYVTVCSEGNQLGGQLTTFATILGYAWAHGLHALFPKEMLLGLPGGEANYQFIFYRLPQELPPGTDPNLPTHMGAYSDARNPFPYYGGNICICGMPNYPLNYFHAYREKIRTLFGPSEEIILKLRQKYESVIDHPKTVAVHVRTYHPSYSIHWCLGEDYYEKAMNRFSNDHLFLIFSDRIGWCKDHLRLANKQVVFIEGNSHIEDLYLISLCKNIIIANSTFSWWGAYLKKDAEGLILAPEKWFPNESPAYRKTFYPSNYTTLPVPTIPTPNWDLLNYESTSIGI